MILSFDIETTGLIGEFKPVGEPETRITCIGFASDSGIQQFSSPPDAWNAGPDAAERSLLHRFSESRLLCNGGDIVTYNGASFDFPLLKERLAKHNLDSLPGDFLHIDQMDFTLLLPKYRCTKEDAAAKYADLYIPKTITSAFSARAYLHKKVTPRIHMQMLQHNAIDVTATLAYHHELSSYPDYGAFVQKLRDAKALKSSNEKKEETEAFL